MNKKIVLIWNVDEKYEYAFLSVLKQLGRGKEDFVIIDEKDEELYRKVEEANPNVIVCFGEGALNRVTNKSSIEKWRGSVIESHPGLMEKVYKVIATYEPSLLVRGGRTKDGVPVRPIILIDLKRAFKQGDYPEIRRKERERIIQPSYLQVIGELNYIRKNKPRIMIDIETEKGRISCIGFAYSAVKAICVPFIGVDGEEYFRGQELNNVNELIREILEDEDIEKAGQNFVYDMAWLERAYECKVRNYKFDNMVAIQTVFPEFPMSLAFQTSIYTDIVIIKMMGKNIGK